MPGFYTHMISADKAIATLDSAEIKALIEKHPREFYLGVQGPDFFEYDTKAFASEEASQRMSPFFHSRTVNESICSMLSRLSTLEGAERDAMFSYILGYLLHYSVDAMIHPYIYYRTGVKFAQVKDPDRFPLYHNKLEAEIDVLLLEKNGLPEPKDYVPSNRIDASVDSIRSIARIYMYVCKGVYGKNVSKEHIIKGFANMKKMVDLYSAPTTLYKLSNGVKGIFKSASAKAERAHFRVPSSIDRSLDQLNLNHRAWKWTWDDRRTFTDDVVTLLDKAIARALTYFSAAYELIYRNASPISFSNAIMDMSMYTGIAWNTPMVHRIFELIYENDALPVIVD